jgi:hypothetical protein
MQSARGTGQGARGKEKHATASEEFGGFMANNLPTFNGICGSICRRQVNMSNCVYLSKLGPPN